VALGSGLTGECDCRDFGEMLLAFDVRVHVLLAEHGDVAQIALEVQHSALFHAVVNVDKLFFFGNSLT